VSSASLPRGVAKAMAELEPFRVWLRKYTRSL